MVAPKLTDEDIRAIEPAFALILLAADASQIRRTGDAPKPDHPLAVQHASLEVN